MRQYWINFKGNQQGPMSIEQIAKMGVDDTAYVWYSGLGDWVKITTVPELAKILINTEEAPELPQEPEVESAESVESETVEQPGMEEVPPLDVIDDSASNYSEQAPNFHPQNNYATPQYNYPAPAQNMPEQEPCPPSNLVWAIIATVVCCTLPGIVGIVFAFLTKKYYRDGNIEKAKKMSDYGAWAIIASIILGLISAPLSCTMNMAQMGMGMG